MNWSRALLAFARPKHGLVPGLFALFLASTSHAQNFSPPPEESMWLAASNHTLDQLRGGFDVGAGLVVSFGISRAVFINGQLVTSTSFQVGDITKLTSAQAVVLSQQISSRAQVLQNGPGNTVDAGAAIVPLAMYIQNTLNNQTIRNETVIQATSSGLSMVKNLNLQATLNDSINNAIRNR
jgi:hypothetical protein